MKKYLSIFLILCLICVSAAGCSDNGTSDDESSSQDAQETVQSNADKSETVSEKPSSALSPQESSAAAEGIDVDLTALSSTMVYAEVYNMMVSPDDYLGKTVKMSGPFYALFYDETSLYYYYVIIEDATACCQQGLEFIWNGDHSYPDDYPEDNAKIEMLGVFESYEELGYTYYHLVVDDISVLEP